MGEEKTIPSAYKIVEGYFINGLFYTDNTCVKEITKRSMTIYIDLPTLEKYQWSWEKQCYVVLKYATDLLPVGTSSSIPVKYRQMNITGSVTSSLSYEHNRMLYIGTMLDYSIFRIQKLNLMTNKLETLIDIPKASIGNRYIGGMLVDDEYIYITTSLNGNNSYRTLYRVNLKTFIIDSFLAPRNFQCYGKIMKYDEQTLVLANQYGLLLFDTINNTWLQKVNTSDNLGTREEMSVGKKRVITHYYSTSTTSPVSWNKDTEIFEKITLPSSAVSISCYGDGKFYIAQTNYLHVYDEETGVIEKSFSIPLKNPKTIDYSDGVLFITQKKSNKVYIYNIKQDMYSSIFVPWTIPDISESGITRPTAFKGYLFIPYITLGIINYTNSAKYNMGYKFDRYIFIFNEDEKQEYTYDENFIEFMDSYVTMKDGIIHNPTITIDEENKVKSISVDKSSYNKLKGLSFVNKQTQIIEESI